MMKTAGPITNNYQDFQVQNLCQLVHHVDGRGPFIVTQDGCDPNDSRMRACSFVLTRRGTWLHFYLYLALSESARAKCTYFETAPEIVRHAESLPAKAVVEDAHSLQELLREVGFEPDASDPSGSALMNTLRQRHAASASAPESASN